MGVLPPPSVEPVVFRGDKREGVEDGVSRGPFPEELVVSGGAEGDRKNLKACCIEYVRREICN